MKKIAVAVAGAVLLTGIVNLGRAQKNQFPYDNYTVDNGITTIHVQGNVWMIQGVGGNVAVQAGERGVVVVDTGLEQNADKLLAAIRKISTRPIQYIINTHMHPDHTGGNDAIRKAGTTITGANVAGNLTDVNQGAQIIAHENVLNRMSAPSGKQAPTPFGAWPTITYVSGQSELLESNPTLALSIRQRVPYLGPLNHLQIQLLRRLRAGESSDLITQGIHLTINGIAAGLRNSG